GGEGARFWSQVFSELKNRRVEDVLIGSPRWAQESAGGDHDHLGTHGGPAVHRAPDPRFFTLRRQAAPRRNRQGLKPDYTSPSKQAAKGLFASVHRTVG